MKTIGLIGGMSWESTLEYYRLINEKVRDRLGGLNSAKIIMNSYNFEEIEKYLADGDWKSLENSLISTAELLERSGAEMILICTNTMHKMAGAIQKRIGVPLLHIADAAAEDIKKHGADRVALLGTEFTMSEGFYTERLKKDHGIDVIIPVSKDRAMVNSVIFDELCRGIIKESSKKEYLRIIDELSDRGAEGIVLGCTEIPLLIKPADTALPLYDTTELHASAAVDEALK